MARKRVAAESPEQPAGGAPAEAAAAEAPAEEPPRLTLADLREIVTDRGELAKGAQIYDAGLLANLARYKNKIFADASGSGASPYKVSLGLSRKSDEVKGRCSCFQARRVPFCKHSAALLVAWARAPESFVVSESGPEGDGAKKTRRVKQGEVSAADLMGQGLQQVSTLLRELAVAGVATVGAERIDQIRTLGEGLRQHKLRRLSARTAELADVLGRAAGAEFDPGEYADLLADMLLTTRKLEKHTAGEALDDRYVEELIGKTWQPRSLPETAGLMLLEYAFSHEQTADGFLIRESRFFELMTGRHYSEKQIIPQQLAARTPPKRSYGGQVLLGAKGRVYPGFAPIRLKLEDPGTPEVIRSESLQQLLGQALPGASAALAAFQEQRRDVFAPDRLPVALRTGVLYAEGAHLRILDEAGQALALPFGPRRSAEAQALEARFAGLLRGVRLRALLGEIDVDDAQPTLYPLAAVVEGPDGLSLRQVTAQAPESEKDRRRRARQAQAMPGAQDRKGQAGWAELARLAGASGAAVALGEVREELAGVLSAGLLALRPSTVDALAQRLNDLGLGRQGTLLREIGAGAAEAARLDEFVKLYQVLDIALVRLCGTVRVERDDLEPVPTYETVHVRRFATGLLPREVLSRRRDGQLGRYEAAAHFARHYEGLSAAELEDGIYPTWADGSATPFIVRALGPRGAEAVRAAHKALRSKGLMAKSTAVQVLQEVATPEAEALLHKVADGEHHQPRSFAQHAYWYWEQGGTVPPLRVLAHKALVRVGLQRGTLTGKALAEVHEQLRKQHVQVQEQTQRALSAATLQERIEGVRWLAKRGDLDAAGALRLAASSDPSQQVRAEAVLALGLLGDGESVDMLVGLLEQRESGDQELAKAAAYALGYLGDARGIDELIRAFREGWLPGVVGEALRAVGGVVLGPLLDLLEANPDLVTRKVALEVPRKVPVEELLAEMNTRLKERATDPGGLAERARLYLKIAGPVAALARPLCEQVLLLSAAATEKELLVVRRQAEKALAEAAAGDKPGKGRTSPGRGTPAM